MGFGGQPGSRERACQAREGSGRVLGSGVECTNMVLLILLQSLLLLLLLSLLRMLAVEKEEWQHRPQKTASHHQVLEALVSGLSMPFGRKVSMEDAQRKLFLYYMAK